jgi:hypothetical protein
LNAAKASERVNLKFLSAAQVGIQAAKDQAIVALITPWRPTPGAVVTAAKPHNPRTSSMDSD